MYASLNLIQECEDKRADLKAQDLEKSVAMKDRLKKKVHDPKTE